MSYKVKKVLKVIALVLVCCTACMTVMHLSGAELKSPTEWFEKDVNPDNLIVEKNYADNLIKETSKGLKVKWNDDGSFVLSGKHEDDNLANAALYESDSFVTVTLVPGDYVLSTGNENADVEKFGLVVRGYGDAAEYVGNKPLKMHVEEATTISVSFFVKNNLRLWGFNSKILPTLVAGTEAGEFYK